MLNLSEMSSRLVGAASSLAITVVLFAYAIVPAEQAATFSGMVA